jgi:Raf kinase inhibitor-like YbhB/YbcL family protein
VQKPGTSLVLRSPAVGEDGVLPKEFTGDGSSISPPLEWSKAPAGTKSYAVIMHHVAPDMVKWYWVLYNIPADTTSLPKNVQGVGTPGSNSMSRTPGYAPPHSKGPGAKQYTITVYALSAAPKISAVPGDVSRDALLEAMKGLILDSAELNVTYTREVGGDDREPPPRPGEKGQKPKPKRSRDQ